MALNRKTVGETLTYKGRVIEAKHIGPDLLCCVDGQDCGNFYLSVGKAHAAGVRYVDDCEKAKEKRSG